MCLVNDRFITQIFFHYTLVFDLREMVTEKFILFRPNFTNHVVFSLVTQLIGTTTQPE